MATQRENVRAGIFVLMGVVLGMVGVYLLTDFRSWFEDRQTVRVFYHLDDGLRGLKPGAQVTLGNVPVGEVIGLADFERDGQIVGQVVTLELPAKYRLRSDARIELDVPTFGSGTKLNITNLGVSPQPYSPDTVIPGSIASNPLAQDVVANTGIDAQRREQVRQIIDNVAAITATLRQDLPQLTGGAKNLLARLEPLVEQAQAAVSDVQATLADAGSVVTRLKDRSTHWFERLDRITESVDDAAARLNTLLADKDADLREVIEQVRAMTTQLNQQALPALEAALDDARAAAAEARLAMVSQRPVIERTLANLQLASGQLKLAMIEVRRSPWRLLYRPDKAEIADDNLYDAARSFAMGASALDATAASLRAMVEDPALDDAQTLKAMLDYLQAVFDKFREVETRFMDQARPRP